VINSYSQAVQDFFPGISHKGRDEHYGHQIRNELTQSLCPSWTLREMICNFFLAYDRGIRKTVVANARGNQIARSFQNRASHHESTGCAHRDHRRETSAEHVREQLSRAR